MLFRILKLLPVCTIICVILDVHIDIVSSSPADVVGLCWRRKVLEGRLHLFETTFILEQRHQGSLGRHSRSKR